MTHATKQPAGNKSAPRVRKEDRYFQRELSWLDFNQRVLEQAENTSHPLLERLKFVAIFSNNLDEFFMIHVPGMQEREDAELGLGPASRVAAANLRSIAAKLRPMLERLEKCFTNVIEALRRHGVELLRIDDLDDAQKHYLAHYFENEIFPVLTPLAVDPGHPFPYISNLSLSLAVVVRDSRSSEERFARVKVPARSVLPRLVPIGSGWRFVLLEEVITAHLGRLFPGMEVVAAYPFRATRNADLELQEEAANDLLQFIEEELPKRRFGELVRLEVGRGMPDSIRRMLMEELEATPDELFELDGPLNLADFMPMANIDIPELRDRPFTPAIPAPLRGTLDLFAAIRQSDILLHHPYDSFGCVVDFLRNAAEDPQVLTIKHTLYRTTGDSQILAALIDAAEQGKQVACIVELKARFDEANNITWAKQLEKSGVHVVYGLVGLKTHCKVSLVVRREDEGLRRYVHVGTGNYNAKTATVYTDIGLLTANADFCADATDLFNFLTGYSRQAEYRQFILAPINLRDRLAAMIRREIAHAEAGRPGHIIAKMNALVDPVLIELLYDASQAGVQVDLIVRGMCCLRPGVRGLSEKIRVTSIVGRFLEHSRIFYFRNDGSEEIYFGSADWMTRNLDRRIEVVAPVLDPDIRATIRDTILRVQLEDTVNAWDLQPDGAYVRRTEEPGRAPRNSQIELLSRLALRHSKESGMA